MKAKKVFYIICISTLVLVLLSSIAFIVMSSTSGASDKTPYVQLYIDVLKTIIVIFFVGLISTLIPEIVQESKYDFKMRREAKKIYSESLTGVMYLSSRLPYLKLAEEAFRHLEELHSKKHLAETYYEHLELKNENAKFIQRRIWPKELDPGEMIKEAKLKVMKIADNWSDMSEKARFDYFNNR